MPRNSRAALAVVLAALAVSACGGGGGSGGESGPPPGNPPPGNPQPGPPPGNPPPVGQLRFSVAAASAGEAGTAPAVMVSRVGGSKGPVSVDMTSSDGTASAGQDYNAVGITVTFADGDADPKPVEIRFIDDALDEQDETFVLTLSNPTGGATLSSAAESTVTLTITDDDDPPPPAQPPSLALDYEIKRLAFSWSAVAEATSYRLMRREAPGEPFLEFASNSPPGLKIRIPVHLYRWQPFDSGLNFPQYRLDACNVDGCSRSDVVSAPREASVSTTGYLKASDTAALARAGTSVSVSGDGNTVAIGAPFADGGAGAVYIYSAAANGPLFSPSPFKISAPSASAMRFGSAVALSDDGKTLAVGAPLDSHDQRGVDTYPVAPNANAPGSGAVFVFTRIVGEWSAPVYMKASDAEAGDEFGFALALSKNGRILVVGAPGQDSPTSADPSNAAVNSGAAYVFSTNSTPWAQSASILKALNVGAEDRFGHAVAMNGLATLVIVGAPNEDGDDGADADTDEDEPDSGAAYEFVRVDQPPRRHKAMNSGAGDLYGTSVAVSSNFNGEVFAVGAPGEDGTLDSVPNDAGEDVGAVYAYTRDGGGDVVDVAYLKASRRRDRARYGSSIAISEDGSTLAVGSPRESVDAVGVDADESAPSTQTDAGAVDVLVRRLGAKWSAKGIATAPEKHYVKASNTGAGDLFGTAVSLSHVLSLKGVLVVGAPGEDGAGRNIDAQNDPADDSADGAGAAYLY